MLVRLMYASRAAETVGPDELQVILRQCKAHNPDELAKRVATYQRQMMSGGMPGQPGPYGPPGAPGPHGAPMGAPMPGAPMPGGPMPTGPGPHGAPMPGPGGCWPQCSSTHAMSSILGLRLLQADPV